MILTREVQLLGATLKIWLQHDYLEQQIQNYGDHIYH